MSVLEGIVQKLKKGPFEWVRDEPTAEDLEHIKREGNSPSQFDPLGLRKQMTDDLASGKAVLKTKSGPFIPILRFLGKPWDRSFLPLVLLGKEKDGVWYGSHILRRGFFLP